LRVICADENIILQDLLKFILLSEMFTQNSIGVSKGSTNPYINWKDFDDFQFKIPNIEIQKEIAGVLNEILSSIEKHKGQQSYYRT
jgi:type I restriction enzyme, S subunit